MQREQQIKGETLLKDLKKAQRPLQTIVVKKEREEEYDQQIDNQWKEARSKFFNQTIKQKLSQPQIQPKHRLEIAQFFRQAAQDPQTKQLGSSQVWKMKKQIRELNQSFKLINQKFFQKQKEAQIITQIIQLKLTQLRVINIQYDLSIEERYRYQVDAFGLFKAVHQNKGLSSVTLKGVLVKEFKKFLKAMTQSRLNKTSAEEWSWMKDFKPLKQLKLSMDAQGAFFLTNKEEDICAIKGLTQFGGLFQQLSVISVKIELNKIKYLTKVRNNTLQQLLEQLAMAGKIKIRIEVCGEYGCLYTDEPFNALLQMLTSLTTIAQLYFKEIQFSHKVGVNRFLAMEEILSTIFEKNAVTRLKLHNCQNFPIFSAITTLQTIYLWKTSFRRWLISMSDLSRNIPSLQSISCQQMIQEWKIEEQMFNQLSRFCILFRQDLNFNVSPHSPSNIKQLTIFQSFNANFDISVLLPKLIQVTQLVLYYIDCGHQIICTIPSTHLALLKMQNNRLLTYQDLEVIDKKWPKLRYLTLWDCRKLDEGKWSAFKFKSLIELRINTEMFASCWRSIRQQLRERNKCLLMIDLKDFSLKIIIYLSYIRFKDVLEDYISLDKHKTQSILLIQEMIILSIFVIL